MVVFEGLATPVWLVVLALTGMVVALSGAAIATILAVPTWIGYWRRWAEDRRHEREVAAAHERALIDDVIRNDLMVLEAFGPDLEPEDPPVRRRHNIHCPTCGRFAKKLPFEHVVECKHHGVLVRWKDIPVDWALRPAAPGVAVHSQIVPAITDAIPIQTIEAFIEIDYEVEGARL